MSEAPGGTQAQTQRAFSRPVLTLVVLLCATSMLVALISGIFGSSAPPTTISNDAFSDSALGHTTFIELLEARFDDVALQRRALYEGPQREDVVIIAEPVLYERVAEDRTEQLDVYLQSEAAIVVFLPKRLASAMTPAQELSGTALILPWDIERLLRYFGIEDARVLQENGMFRKEGLVLSQPQHLNVAGGEPTLLLRRQRANGAPLLIVADPDVIANHGIGDGDNAAFALGVVEEALRGGRIIVDERLHGHVDTASISRRAFDFPTILVTLQLLVLVLVLAWKSAVSFSPRAPIDNVRDRDQSALVRTTASLMSWASAPEHGLARYQEMLIADAARRLHAPTGLQTEELVEWLDGAAERQQRSVRLAPLVARAQRAKTREEIRTTAELLHRWHREVTDAA